MPVFKSWRFCILLPALICLQATGHFIFQKINMNKHKIIPDHCTFILLLAAVCFSLDSCSERKTKSEAKTGVAVLLIDTDRKMGDVEEDIYGQFLEHINHSVEDGLFAEQIQGMGFEGKDFDTYWKPAGDKGSVQVVNLKFENGEKSIRLRTDNDTVGIHQSRIYIQNKHEYNGSVWIKSEAGSLQLVFRIKDSAGNVIAEAPLQASGMDWQEVSYSFTSTITDRQASVEIMATGSGSVLLDFISMMDAAVRKNGMLRPDLLNSLQGLKPTFIRWPGGSFASIYKWKDGIGTHVSRKYHPNEIWGGYSDYYGFGTDEFLELCRQLNTKPLIVLNATTTDTEQVEYAMDWVHYLNDPSTSSWGKMRTANGHPEPYNVEYFQIDNESMNHKLTADQYAAIVNVYGSRLREIAPHARIIACGQKRSNDMNWSEKIINIAGKNFDILGCHNYEYENENFQTGLQRINDYLVKLRDYIHASAHPDIKLAVLEWGLCRSYDWRAGLHAAGNLIMYEKLSPELEMSCPAVLMRNTTDDSTWRGFIYHDHVSWFPGSGYVAEKLFREHYAKKHFASTSGTFRDIDKRNNFFDDISQMKPEDWQPGTVDAIATGSEDGRRIVIKAVNYTAGNNLLLVRLQGSSIPANATVKLYTLKAGPTDAPSMEHPDKIKPMEHLIPYAMDMSINLEPYSVLVAEIVAE